MNLLLCTVNSSSNNDNSSVSKRKKRNTHYLSLLVCLPQSELSGDIPSCFRKRYCEPKKSSGESRIYLQEAVPGTRRSCENVSQSWRQRQCCKYRHLPLHISPSFYGNPPELHQRQHQPQLLKHYLHVCEGTASNPHNYRLISVTGNYFGITPRHRVPSMESVEMIDLIITAYRG